MKSVGIILLLAGLSSFVMAAASNVPEISPASGAAALALVSGALLVMRGRRNH